jgi:hypothetical protein
MIRCYNCKFWATKDHGYSNLTVTETDVHCMKNHFEPIEESYSWNRYEDDPENDHIFFKQAELCPDFIQETGTIVRLDVNGETTIEDFKNDIEVYEAAKLYFANNESS